MIELQVNVLGIVVVCTSYQPGWLSVAQSAASKHWMYSVLVLLTVIWWLL